MIAKENGFAEAPTRAIEREKLETSKLLLSFQVSPVLEPFQPHFFQYITPHKKGREIFWVIFVF